MKLKDFRDFALSCQTILLGPNANEFVRNYQTEGRIEHVIGTNPKFYNQYSLTAIRYRVHFTEFFYGTN